MKIVVTNESGLTDVHLDELRKVGDVEVYKNTNEENINERLKDAEVAVLDVFLTSLNKEFFERFPSLKYISINSTGYDNIDLVSAKQAEVLISHVPTFSTGSVAELAIGLMFASVRKIAEGDKEFRNGLHAVDPGTAEAEKYMGFNLEGKTLGVIGLGNIGTRIAEIGKGIGMNVVAYNRTRKDVPGVKMVSADELMTQSDVVIVSLALNTETTGFVTKEMIESMKKSGILINIANMDIVDKEALVNALNSESIAGAGLDTADQTMVEIKNTVLTPHIAYNTHESMENMGKIILNNIKGYMDGKPINLAQ